MPAVGGGGRGNAGKSTKSARRAARKASPKPYTPQSVAGEASRPANRTNRANKFKRTSPKYAQAIRDAYDANTSDRKQQILKKAKGREGKIVRKLHSQRDRNAAQSGRRDTPFTDSERAAIWFLKKDPAWKKLLADTRRERAVRGELEKGFKPEGTLDMGFKLPAGLLSSGAAVAEGTYKDPVGVPLKTAKQLGLAIPATVGGAVELVRRPKYTVEEGVKGFVERVNTPYDEKVQRVREEGALSDAADAAVVIAPTSAAWGKFLRGSGRGKSAPSKRTSGGTLKPMQERVGLTGALLTAKDKAHARRLERRLQDAEAGGAPIDALDFQAAKANRAAGTVVELPTRAAKRAQRKDVAKRRGRAIYALKSETGRRVTSAAKRINRLSKAEKRAFYYAAALGIRSADQAREVLPKLRDRITETRAREGIQVKGSLKRSDILPEIDAILAKPEAHFTARLGEVIEELRPDSIRAGREDPSLKDALTRTRRRYAPLADVLGLERGVRGGGTEWRYVPGEEDFRRAAEARRRTQDDTLDSDLVGLPRDREIAGELPSGSRSLPAARRELAKQPEGGDVGAVKRPEKGYYEEVPRPLRYDPDETEAQFLQRVIKEAEASGLARPLYFREERYAAGPRDYAAYALGGAKAARPDRRRKGTNLRQGLLDTRPEQYLTGLARNTKRKHNWNLVADILDANALKEFSEPGGTTIKALRERLARAGVDMSSVAFWDSGAYRRMAESAPDEISDGERWAQTEEFGQAQVAEALNKSVVRASDPIPEEVLNSTRRWHVVPLETLRELERETKNFSGAAGRTADILKGKASRAILLAGNVPWLGFQVASNTLMSAAATGGRALNPANWLGAARWWKELSPQERDRVGAYLGLDATSGDTQQVRLGATTNRDFVNAYRAWKAHPIWHTGVLAGRGPSISQLNPLELMAQADRRQNNVFRIVAGYSMAKREAVRRMGENMAATDRLQARIMANFVKPPAEQLRTLARDKELLEEHAERVTDWMGDYTTLTAAERKVFNRLVMFYPYVRYSLRLVFYTLPVKHPTTTALLAELGQLRVEELRKIFGGDELYWNIGKIYFGKGGNVKSIDLRKANPALNAVIDTARTVGTEGENPGQLLGVLPPYAGWLFDQATHRSNYFDRDWRVRGKAAPYGVSHADYNLLDRLRVLGDDALSITFPYRTAKNLDFNPAKMGEDPDLRGTQGDDSLLWDPRPLQFKGDDADAKLQRKFAGGRERFEEENESLLRELVPFIPEPNRDQATAREQRIIDRAVAPAKKRKRTKSYGISGGSGKPFGASGSGNTPFGAGR